MKIKSNLNALLKKSVFKHLVFKILNNSFSKTTTKLIVKNNKALNSSMKIRSDNTM